MSTAADDILSEMQTLTIGDLARRGALLFGDRPYLVDEVGEMSFAAVDQLADRYAAGLRAAGIGKGSKVAVWLPNNREWVVMFVAVARIGALMVPVNTRYKPDEVRYVLERSEAQALVMLRSRWSIDYIEMLGEVAPGFERQTSGRLAIPDLPALRLVVLADEEPASGTTCLGELVAAAAAQPRGSEDAPSTEDVLLICYTSGSTGKPKGVMHTHGVIGQSVRVGLAMHMDATTPILGHMPFYHSAGLFMALIPALALGSPLVLMEDWKADRALDLIAGRGIARIGGIPTHFYDLVDAQLARPRDLSSLEAAWIGGSAIMQSSFSRIMTVLGLDRLMSTYGMTENTISTTFNRWDDPIERCCSNSAPKLSDCEVRIVDPATLAPCAIGAEGELWCRGTTVTTGYYRDPEATAAVLTTDGWLRTGDMAVCDAEGYIAITGRLKEILKVGGVNVAPIEVEQVLASHPMVRAAAVVAMPDDRLTEVPLAFVEVLDGTPPTAGELIDFCRAKMARYKVPRRIVFVDALPRTETGKVKRGELAARVKDEAMADDTRSLG